MKSKLIKITLILLFITPWILTLSFGKPSLKPLPSTQPRLVQTVSNLKFYSSFEFLFFSGDRRPLYGIAGFGVFLLSFLPIIAIGLFNSSRPVIYSLILGFTISCVFSNAPGLPGSLWFLVPLSVIAGHGFSVFISSPKTIKYLFIALIAYEGLRLYQVLIFQQPFTL